MITNIKILLFIFVAIIFSGCTAFHPLPVKEGDINADLAKISTETYLGVAKDKAGAMEHMEKYAKWYQYKANEFQSYLYKISDVSLGFGSLGIIAGVLKSPEYVAGSALLSSFVQQPKSRYDIAVQVTNFNNASKAMHCMKRYLDTTVDDSYHPSQLFLVAKIDEVREKLRQVQAAITVSEADVDGLEKNIQTIIRGQAANKALNQEQTQLQNKLAQLKIDDQKLENELNSELMKSAGGVTLETFKAMDGVKGLTEIAGLTAADKAALDMKFKALNRNQIKINKANAELTTLTNAKDENNVKIGEEELDKCVNAFGA